MLDRYLFRSALLPTLALMVLALLILMMERLLRVIEIAAVSTAPLRDAGAMMANLIPHYLGLAVPISLMIAVIVTVERLSREEELTAVLAAGGSLWRITRPFMLLAALLCAASLVVEGYLQPLTRYGYRAAAHLAVQQGITGAFREGRFVSFEGRTVFAGGVGREGRLTEVFVYDTNTEEVEAEARVLAAPEGLLAVDPATRAASLYLLGGEVTTLRPGGQPQTARFARAGIGTPDEVAPFRARGEDSRELTLGELARAAGGEGPAAREAGAALHYRLGRAAILLFFPLLAVPFGLTSSRASKASGVAAGLLVLVLVQKLLEGAQGAALRGLVPGWASSWPVVALFAGVSVWLFWRSGYTTKRPPLENLRLPAVPRLPGPLAALARRPA